MDITTPNVLAGQEIVVLSADRLTELLRETAELTAKKTEERLRPLIERAAPKDLVSVKRISELFKVTEQAIRQQIYRADGPSPNGLYPAIVKRKKPGAKKGVVLIDVQLYDKWRRGEDISADADKSDDASS